MVGPENEVQVRREVREVVLGLADARMMPMVQLRRSEEVPQRSQREPHVGMDEDRPHPAEDHERPQQVEPQPEEDAGQVQERLRAQTVQRVLSMGCQPVQVLHRMVDRVKAPQEVEMVAGAMEPIDAQIPEHERERRLPPDRERRDRRAHIGEGEPAFEAQV